MSEQQYIEFDKKEKATLIDNRKIGVAFICFEDMLMNYSSNLKFSTSTSNWRRLQQALKMGDYGGSLDPHYILIGLEKIKCEVDLAALSDPNCLDAIIAKLFDIENGTLLFEKLEAIAKVAEHAGTKVRVMTAQFIGTV